MNAWMRHWKTQQLLRNPSAFQVKHPLFRTQRGLPQTKEAASPNPDQVISIHLHSGHTRRLIIMSRPMGHDTISCQVQTYTPRAEPRNCHCQTLCPPFAAELFYSISISLSLSANLSHSGSRCRKETIKLNSSTGWCVGAFPNGLLVSKHKWCSASAYSMGRAKWETPTPVH